MQFLDESQYTGPSHDLGDVITTPSVSTGGSPVQQQMTATNAQDAQSLDSTPVAHGFTVSSLLNSSPVNQHPYVPPPRAPYNPSHSPHTTVPQNSTTYVHQQPPGLLYITV